jgi:hypothetical protein
MAPQWPWPLVSPYEIDLSSCSPSKIPRSIIRKKYFLQETGKCTQLEIDFFGEHPKKIIF